MAQTFVILSSKVCYIQSIVTFQVYFWPKDWMTKAAYYPWKAFLLLFIHSAQQKVFSLPLEVDMELENFKVIFFSYFCKCLCMFVPTQAFFFF